MENTEQVPQTVVSTIIYLAFESTPFGFLVQGRLVVSLIYMCVYRGNLDG